MLLSYQFFRDVIQEWSTILSHTLPYNILSLAVGRKDVCVCASPFKCLPYGEIDTNQILTKATMGHNNEFLSSSIHSSKYRYLIVTRGKRIHINDKSILIDEVILHLS